MTANRLICVHDMLDTQTTLCYQESSRMVWCVACGGRRTLTPMHPTSVAIAYAARDGMFFLEKDVEDIN
jgi:hypothetical protein